jgi:parallel beta-helix repeat protein
MLLPTATAVVCAEQLDTDNETLDENHIEKLTLRYLEFFNHQNITKQRNGLKISECDSYVNTEPSKKIKDFQQQIYNKGYNYTVAENWITQLTPEERDRLLGYKSIKPPTDPLPVNVGFHSIDDFSGSGMVKQSLVTHPSSYDAMALGYVTPVRNQGACSSCWIFGPTANLESSIAIREGCMPDFSEQEIGDCNIWSRFCNGGSDFFVINYLTKKGITDEFYNPYVATPQTCFDFPLLKNVDNWRIITGDDGDSQISKIKDAILNYGQVTSTIYTSNFEFHRYSGGVYEYWGTEDTNHMVQIIGWDDSKPHSHGTGAWLIKNNWGNDWASDGPYPGCAWVAYGSANLGDHTSSISGYSNASSQIYYHDEYGWMCYGFGYGSGNNSTTWGAVRFTPTRDSQLESVDFWAVDANMSYEIMVFDNISSVSSYTFSNQLGTTQTGSTDEMGYYSIRLNTPILLTKGDDFIVQVRFNTTTSTEPVPIDYILPGEWCYNDWKAVGSGESYVSNNGTLFLKLRINGILTDIGIRARTNGLEYGDAPDPTYPTLSASDGARHNPTDTECIGLKITNGDWKETEPDARVPNSDTFDDGVRNIPIVVNNSSQTVTFEVTDILAPSSNLTVNILIDLNRDGDWNDLQEHVVVNQKIITTSQEQVVISQPFSTTGASQGSTWLRITLTRHNISNTPWDGTMHGYARTIPFEYGETEDWNIYLIEAGAQHVCNLNTGEEFLTIQSAIDAAGTLDGHTISIDPGTYYETVNVNKQLTIRSSSEDPTDTIIDAFDQKDHVINVVVDNVNISGLTVTGAINSFKAGIYLRSSVDHCNISNNRAANNYYGILMESSSNNKFTRNTIELNKHDGICLQSSNNNTFIDNFIKLNKDYGICIGSSGNNSFINNIVKSNYKDGIYIKSSSSNNTLMNNTANSNKFSGICLRSSGNNTLTNNTAYSNSYGIYLSSSSNNTLMNNTANLNKINGIYLSSSGSNTLTNNTMSGNKYNFKIFGENLYQYIQNIDTSNTVNNKSIYYWVDQQNKIVPNDAGYVVVVNSTNITIRDPTLTNNYEGVLFAYTTNSLIENFTTSSNCDGIFLASSSNNTLTNNTINSNKYDGISLFSSSNNSLTNNTINSNQMIGIWLSSSSNNSLTNNIISSNKYDGIRLSSSSNNILTNNTINSNKYDGISLSSSSNNSLTNNTISNNDDGISLSSSSNNSLTNNTISNNDDGISLSSSSNNSLTNNTINSNQMIGIWLSYSSNNSFTYNIISSNKKIGIYLRLSGNNTLSSNNISGNTNNFRVSGVNLSHYVQSIDMSNTVDQKPIYYWIDQKDKVVPGDAGFVGVVNSTNITVRDQTLTKNTDGMLFAYTSNSLIENITVSSNYNGIYLQSSNNNTLRNNTALNNSGGICLRFSSNNTLTNNTMSENMYNFKIFGMNLSHFIQSMDISNTVDKKPVYYWVDQRDKVVPNDAGYVGIINSTNITTSDLSITNNYGGVMFAYTTNSLIENITASLNYEGISLISSNNNTLINNIANSNEAGICLAYSSNNTIINNTVDSNDFSGIILFYSNDNLIYNNYFNNEWNAVDIPEYNIWNINKTAGKNIIGGSWLGGNYWSDYEGKDTDGDGLGDTLLPYRSSGRIKYGGDYLPLVLV